MTTCIRPVALLAILLCACTASPQKAPPAASSALVPAVPAGAGAAAAVPQKAAVQYDRTEVLDKRAREMGYKVETRGGERSYCRNTAPTGSHISREACLTQDAMARVAKAADDDQDQISQRQLQSSSAGSRLP